MDYQVIEKNNQKYILLGQGGSPVQTEQDGLELVSACIEHGTNMMLIEDKGLSDDFMRLSTGVAGAILQKFALYNIKAAVVLDKDRAKGKFKDFLTESNRGSMFRAYTDFTEAESWLLCKD